MVPNVSVLTGFDCTIFKGFGRTIVNKVRSFPNTIYRFIEDAGEKNSLVSVGPTTE